MKRQEREGETTIIFLCGIGQTVLGLDTFDTSKIIIINKTDDDDDRRELLLVMGQTDCSIPQSNIYLGFSSCIRKNEKKLEKCIFKYSFLLFTTCENCDIPSACFFNRTSFDSTKFLT